MARHIPSIPSLIDWISDRQRRAALAEQADTSGDYLYQIATGRRRASVDLAEAIEEGTDSAVRKEWVLFGEPAKKPTRPPLKKKAA